MEELNLIFGKGADPILVEKLKNVFFGLRLFLKRATSTMVKEKYVEMFGFDVLPKAKKQGM